MTFKSGFFDKIGIADMEKVHSAIIGWMFSNDCHALDKKQKSEILCKLFGVTPVEEFKSIRVEVESHDIDILILTDEGTTNAACWVIENKVKSSQHSNQLDKYVSIVNGEKIKIGRSIRVVSKYEAYKKHFCFLTLVEESAKSEKAKWKNTTYKEFLSQLSNKMLLKTDLHDDVILGEYIQCITNLSNALEDFLNNHEAYENVFTDGGKKKWEKANIKGKGCFVKYISDNGLETIFQKCFLSQINQKTTKWKSYDDFGINETHGVALIEYGIKKENGMSYGIQFQNGAFKVQVVGLNEIAAFWNYWDKVLKDLCLPKGERWDINYSKGRKKPYFSISKRIGDRWYNRSVCVCEIAKDWDSMYDECMKIIGCLSSPAKGTAT